MPTDFLIGTRGSLLAVTQCTLIKEELEKNSNKSFDLKLISTQGDQQTSKPLWQLDGKDFFTKELDTELLSNTVDLVVHSYKDLGSDRPEGIHLAAVTQRSFANDILLIKNSTINELNSKSEIVVGTSSPRRITNIESSLAPYLPNLKENTPIKTKMLRGNVNTRIQKLKDGDYDAIVLAHAGIERLALREDSKKELIQLLDGLNFLILPQRIFPSCASQGALGIEINESRLNTDIDTFVKSVHCENSFQEIKVERDAFKSYGGGCHLAVGIHAKKVNNFLIRIEKGIHNDKVIESKEILNYDYKDLEGLKPFYVMGKTDTLINKDSISTKVNNSNIFVTSSYCIENIEANFSGGIFSAGNRTARKLIEAGFWVNGSAEGFGHDEILKLKASESLKLMLKEESWSVLSHDKASSDIGDNIACYTRSINDEIKIDVDQFDIFYWFSEYQFDQYTKKFPQILNKKHATGLGKTFTALKDKVDVIPFIDISHFKNTVGQNE